MRSLALATLIMLSSPARADDVSPDDIAAVRANPTVITDGKGHFLVYATIMPARSGQSNKTAAFYGDRTTLHRYGEIQIYNDGRRESGAGPFGAKFTYYHLGSDLRFACQNRFVKVEALPATAAKELVAQIAFKQAPRWERVPQRLARDDSGVYYFADAASSSQRSALGDHRIYVGKRGGLQRAKLKDVVVDAAGELYITDRGTLKVTTFRNFDRSADPKGCSIRLPEASWIAQGKSQALTWVGVDDANVASELGVYVGEKLGTPCDVF